MPPAWILPALQFIVAALACSYFSARVDWYCESFFDCMADRFFSIAFGCSALWFYLAARVLWVAP